MNDEDVKFNIELIMQCKRGIIYIKEVDNMANTQNFSVRMDKKVKKESEILFQNLGMNLTTAINVFLRQAIRTGGFPFEIKVDQPNRETLLALIEADAISEDGNAPGYDDVEEALKELKQ